MYFVSTRNEKITKSLTDAIHYGLAEDSGLFVPQYFPQFNLEKCHLKLPYPEFAEKVLHDFFLGDQLEKYLPQICRNAFSFSVPLKELSNSLFVLELFHGPTLSFKDFGARFLAQCIDSMSIQPQLTIMVATSGDTGSAVASAFNQKSNSRVIILYPRGQISKRQEQQITCWDNNILALSIDGTFDHCQRLVKMAFEHPWWQRCMNLSCANSINIGRLLPQIIYYAHTSFHFYHQYNDKPGFIIPTGNLGNATAAYWAKAMGFPIAEIVLATNANKVIEDYLVSGIYSPKTSIATLANAMDVGNPSNFERLKHLLKTFKIFTENVSSFSVNDEEIRKTIKNTYQSHETIICPHTATAYHVSKKLSHKPWIIIATAHSSKFNNVIEPIIGGKIPIPDQLKVLLNRRSNFINAPVDLEKIKEIVSHYFNII